MGEDHSVKLDGAAEEVLSDFELLLAANLIHEHMHLHGRLVHEHLHAHKEEHRHGHET